MLRFPWRLVLALALLTAPARAEELPTFSLRALSVQAPNIVLAVPVDARTPTRFKAAEVFRGSAIHPGEVFSLDGLSAENLQVHEETESSNQKPRQRRIAQALLFLGRPGHKGDRLSFPPLASGLRFWTEEKELLVPEQLRNPGDYVLMARPGMDWPALVRQVKADVAEVDRVLRMRNLAQAERRNQALLNWVERHRHEFGGGFFTRDGEEPQGWGSLETWLFEWILESGRPEDSWAAARLYAGLYHGKAPHTPGAPFANRAGRHLLLGVVQADRTLEGDRARALTYLADPQTLWIAPSNGSQLWETLGNEEQGELIERLTPLLKSSSAPVRSAATRALQNLSHPNDAVLHHRETKRALPALVAAYRSEPAGPVRDDLAEAVCLIGGSSHWQELTGNPSGLLARLCDLEQRGKEVSFWLSLSPTDRSVYECPTLVLERMDPRGKVLETKNLPLPVVAMPRPWSEGWDGSALLLVQFSLEQLAPGTWRIGVQGTVGKDKDKVKWSAEPRMITQDPPKKNPTSAIRKLLR
jgi:hypothetical protein